MPKYKSAPTGRIFSTKKEAQEDAYAYYVAKRLSDQTKRTPIRYIGGTPDEARAKFWEQEPVIQHAVDSISKRYGISGDALKYRINHEGFVDDQIKRRNGNGIGYYRGYQLLKSNGYSSGISDFGLDDVATLIETGKVKPINENWMDTYFINEQGRETHGALGNTTADNIGLTAATLKYFTDIAKKDNPDISDYDANRYGLAYYNRGVVGGRKWVKSGAKGYNYRRRLESRGKLTK